MRGGFAALCGAGMALTLALLVLGAARGATALPVGDALRALLSPLDPALAGGLPRSTLRIVLDLRLPRALLAGFVGAGLAATGAMLQTATRNDLADPFLFGLSSGAAAGAVGASALLGDRLGVWTTPAAAFAGALVAAGTVVALAAGQGGRGAERLVLAGLATSFLFGAATAGIVFAGDQRGAAAVLFWTFGGLGLASWSNLGLAAAGAALAVGGGLALHRRLDALLAGEEAAASLGVDVGRLRLAVFALSALSTAALVSLAGVVGFVGLMVPHLARALAGVRHRRLVAASALIGAPLVMAADLLSRTLLAPQELPLGVFTAAAGGAFVLALVARPSRF